MCSELTHKGIDSHCGYSKLLWADNGHRLSCYLQLRSVRGQLASSTSACTTAEGRSRQLSSQVSEKIAELAQLREEAEKANSSYRMVCRKPSSIWLSAC